jgi:integrase
MGRRTKLWNFCTGKHGARVRVAERVPGGALYAMTTAPSGKGWRKVSLGHKDKARAMEEALKLATRRQKGDEPLQRLTVAGLFDLFTRSVLPRHCPHHQGELTRGIELWTRFLGPARVVETIGPTEWEAFQRVRAPGELDGRGNTVEDLEKRRPVGPRTLEKELKVLRTACRRATIERTPAGGFVLTADPTRGLPFPTEKNPKRPTADSERFDKLIAVADQVTMRRGWGGGAVWEPSYLPLLLRLAGDTGRRISSILALRWSDWLPSEGTFGALRWRAESDKLGREWVVPVSALLAAALKAERARRSGIGELLIFPAPNDATTPVDVRLVTRWLRQAETLAGLAPMDRGAWHPFRRMWACQRKHLPARDVAAAGGWRNIGMLQSVYEAADQETLEAVVSGGRRVRGILR